MNNRSKKQVTVNYAKHTALSYAGAFGAGLGIGAVKAAADKMFTTNPVANIAIAAGGSVATVAGLAYSFDNTIKSYADIKELIDIEETARRLSNIE